MIAPVDLLAEIEIIKKTCQSDLTKVGHRTVCVGIVTDTGKAANDPVTLCLENSFHLHAFRPEARLIDHKKRRIHDAVHLGGTRQHLEARVSRRRQQLATPGQRIQIFDDYAAVIEGMPVSHQRRNLAKRIDRANLVIRITCVRRAHGDPVRHSKTVGGELDLAAEWRGGGGIEDHLQVLSCAAEAV